MGYFSGELNLHEALEGLPKLPKCQEFVGSQSFGAAFVGGEGSAKSVSLMVTCILHALREDNGLSLVGRLNMPALESTTMQTFLELVPSNLGDWAEAKHTWTFNNGHRVLFRHLDITDPKVQGHIKSLNLSKAYIDEASEVDEKVFLLIVGRLRRKSKGRKIIRLASNPAGHDYMWRHFFDPHRKPEWKQMFHGVGARSADNVFLGGDYLLRQKNLYPPDWYERFSLGHFTDFTDLVYKEFTEPTHVYDDTHHWACFGDSDKPPAGWPCIVGMDIGSGSEGDPWALPIISVSPDGALYQFAEIYGVDLRISPIAQELQHHLEGRTLEGLAYDYAQRAAAQELDDHGIYGVPAMKERRPGLFKTEQYMHIDPRLVHPFTGFQGAPRYFVAKSCINTITELSAYKWPKDRSGNPKNDFSTNHEHSHMPDGIRYAIHTFRPSPQEIKVAEKWNNPQVPIMSKMFWQKKAENDQKIAKLNHLKRTPFLSSRKAVGLRHLPVVGR